MSADCEVLVVGAGPTGLVLALWLSRLGVRVRIVDKTAEPGTTSRALVVHARILEHYAQLGLAQEIVARGLKFAAANLWVAGRKVARAPFGDMGRGLSAFPYAVIFPQDEHEAFLVAQLERVGIAVERRTELVSFRAAGDAIDARLRRADGSEETVHAAYLAGCDGAHSVVREAIGAGFPGGTYDHMFYVADVEAGGPVLDHELHAALDTSDFLGMFPLKAPGHVRLVGIVREDAVSQQRTLAWEDVSKGVVERMGIEVRKVHWFSTYHVHHRVARIFRSGRAFLLGDAAHIHSPVGGQGMNTGIGDAINLSWKLAAVLRGRGDDRLLETYQPERRAFACRLVASTDRAFTFATQDGPVACFVRLRAVPLLVPLAFSLPALRRFMFGTISQTSIEYRDSWLSVGSAGRVKGGDRPPWVALEGGRDNFAPLASLDWQVHVYGEATADVAAFCREKKLPLHAFPWTQPMHSAGLARDALYLMRPDGYVGFADATGSPAKLETYLREHAGF